MREGNDFHKQWSSSFRASRPRHASNTQSLLSRLVFLFQLLISNNCLLDFSVWPSSWHFILGMAKTKFNFFLFFHSLQTFSCSPISHHCKQSAIPELSPLSAPQRLVIKSWTVLKLLHPPSLLTSDVVVSPWATAIVPSVVSLPRGCMIFPRPPSVLLLPKWSFYTDNLTMLLLLFKKASMIPHGLLNDSSH